MEKGSPRTDLRGADTDVLQIVALQSGDPRRIQRVLDLRNRLRASIVPHVVPLLGVRTVAAMAMQALTRVADQHPGALIDALLNPSQDVAVRRRLARVLSACRSQVVADGLWMAADDDVSDVRVQSVRSLFRIRRQWPDVRVDAGRVLDLVRADLVRETTDLAHVFTLLSFVVPVKPLRAAYRGLKATDTNTRGTAIEYLHEVLPKDVREALLRRVNPR